MNNKNAYMSIVHRYVAPVLFFVASLALGTDPHTVHPTDEATAKRENTSLDKGTIPIRLQENLHIVPPKSKTGKDFQTAMEPLGNRLFPEHNHKKYPIHYVLVDSDKIGAYSMPRPNRAYIVVTTAALDKLTHIDQLADLVAQQYISHQLAHRSGRPSISKMDTAVANVQAREMLYEAGFQPEQSLELQRVLAEQEKASGRSASGWFQNEWGAASERGIVEKSLANLRLQIGSLDETEDGKPLRATNFLEPEWIPLKKLFKSKQTNATERKLNKRKYSTLSQPEKIKLLNELLSESQYGFEARKQSLVKAFRELEPMGDIEHDDDPRWVEMSRLVDTIVHLPDSVRSDRDKYKAAENTRIMLYSIIANKYDPSKKPTPLGPIYDLNQKAADFRDAVTLASRALNQGENAKAESYRQTAVEAAKEFNQAIKELKTDPSFLKRIDLSTFAFPKKKNQIVDWEAGVRWMRRDIKGANDIGVALWNLGITETRVSTYMDDNSRVRVLLGQHKPISSGPMRKGKGILYLQIGMDGEAIAINKAAIDDPMQAENLRTSVLLEQLEPYIEPLLERAIKEIETTPPIKNPQDLDEIQAYREATPALSLLKNVAQFRKHKTMSYSYSSSSLDNAPDFFGVEHFETHPDLVISLNSNALIDDPRHSRTLINKFNELIKKEPDRWRPYVRNFFISTKQRRSMLLQITGTPQNEAPGTHGLELKHPLIQFVTRDPNNLFGFKEKLNILSQTNALGIGNMDDDFEGRVARVRKIMGYSRPNTTDELYALFDSLRKHNHPFATYLTESEAALFTERYPTQKLDLDRVVSHIKPYFTRDSAPLKEHLQELVDTKADWPDGARPLLKLFKTYEDAKLFNPDGVVRYELINKILVAIKPFKKPGLRLPLIERLISTGRIHDPTLRRETQLLWAKTVRDKFGFDNGSASYHDDVMAQVDRVGQKMNYQDRHDLFDMLANEIKSQEKLSESLGDARVDSSGKLWSSNAILGGTELTVEILRRDANLRSELTRFLRNPLTESNLSRMTETVLDIPRLMDKEIPESAARKSNRFLHQNFWASPMEVRAAMIDELILPSDQRTDEDFERVTNEILADIFPKGTDYSEESRELVRLYMEAVPDYQRSLVLSALLVAAEQTLEQQGKLSVGERLALILEILGPAEIKLGQVIHSHPDTPENIRSGMGRMKSGADVISRWDLFALHGKTIPDNLKKRIKHVHKVLGAASYFITYEVDMEVTKDNGEKTIERRVIALMRPNAKKRAKTGFGVMRKMATEWVKKNPKLKVVIQMIEQASRMSEIETDWEKGVEQAKHAHDLYEGTKVKVGEREFEIHVAHTTEAGEGYRVMEKAPGVHFNDLPEKTKKQKKFKREVALAHVTLELSKILRGGRFDHDRHGAQLRVDVKTGKIYLFDFGAMALEDQNPNTEERKDLADILYDSLKAIHNSPELETNNPKDNEGRKFAEILLNKIAERSNGEKPPDYLMSVEKALLALGDFFKYTEPGDMQDIVRAVVEEGKIHGEIGLQIMNRFVEDASVSESKVPMLKLEECNNILISISQVAN